MSAQAWVVLVVGVLGFAGVLVTLVQRNRADNRAEAWNRISYCLDKMLSDREQDAALGMDVLAVVAESPFITPSERGVLRVAAKRFSDEVAGETVAGDTDGESEEV